MTFAVVFPHRPPAYQSKPNRKFQAALRQAGRRVWGEQPPLDGPLYARIMWFHSVPRTGDIDNIVKNIVDALETVVYRSDSALVCCTTRSIDVRGPYQLLDGSLPGAIASDAYDDLLVALAGTPEHALYVEVGPVDGQSVVFGPPDGSAK